MRFLLLLPVVFALACAGTDSEANYPEGCRDADLAALTAKHTQELVLACSEYDSLEDCPSEYQEQINKAFEEKYAAWRDCK